MSDQMAAAIRWGTIGVSVIAGAWTLFHIFWELNNQTADDYWGTALLILFLVALILAFMRFFYERPALTANPPTERFPEPAISKFFLASTGAAGVWFVARMDVGAEWFIAGWEKVQSPVWGSSGIALTGFVKGALAKTTGPNPAVQGWYASFLTGFRSSQCGIFLVPGDLGRSRGGAGDSGGRADRDSGGLRGLDEPELPAGWHSQRQSNPGSVRPIPGHLLARLRLAWR